MHTYDATTQIISEWVRGCSPTSSLTMAEYKRLSTAVTRALEWRSREVDAGDRLARTVAR